MLSLRANLLQPAECGSAERFKLTVPRARAFGVTQVNCWASSFVGGRLLFCPLLVPLAEPIEENTFILGYSPKLCCQFL